MVRAAVIGQLELAGHAAEYDAVDGARDEIVARIPEHRTVQPGLGPVPVLVALDRMQVDPPGTGTVHLDPHR